MGESPLHRFTSDSPLHQIYFLSALLLGTILLLAGRRISAIVTGCSAMVITAMAMHSAYSSAGVDFVQHPFAWIPVVGSGLAATALAQFYKTIGRLVCGFCLGTFLRVLISQPLLLIPGVINSTLIQGCGWALVVLSMASTLCSDFITRSVYPSLLGGLLVLLVIEHWVAPHAWGLGQFSLESVWSRPHVLCSGTGCWGLFALWPVVSCCGALFQFSTRHKDLPCAGTANSHGYEAIPSRDVEAVATVPPKGSQKGKPLPHLTQNGARGGLHHVRSILSGCPQCGAWMLTPCAYGCPLAGSAGKG